jgi:hypothetical protein
VPNDHVAKLIQPGILTDRLTGARREPTIYEPHGVGVNLATNEPTPEALRAAVRTVLDRPAYRMRASQMADEFARIDTRSEILSIIDQAILNQKVELWAETMTTSQPQRTAQQR